MREPSLEDLKSKRKFLRAAARHLARCRPDAVARCKNQCADKLLRPEGASERQFALSRSRSMGLTSPQRSNFSVLRNRASRINGPAISPHGSLLRRSTALAALDPRCKPCARPAMRTMIGRFGCVVDRIICGFYIANFTSALPLKADSGRTSRQVGFVPTNESASR